MPAALACDVIFPQQREGMSVSLVQSIRLLFRTVSTKGEREGKSWGPDELSSSAIRSQGIETYRDSPMVKNVRAQ